MKQFKHAAVALAMVGMLSAQANASEVQVQNLQAAQPIAAFSQTDIDAMFEQAGQPMQLAALSQQEMRETEGAMWHRVAWHGLGGVTGMYGAGYGYLAGGGRSPTGFLVAAGGGFAAGAWSPVNGFRSAATTFGSSFTGGAIGGWASRRGW